MLTETFSYNLRLLRHKNKWKQEEIATRMELSVGSYSKIEAGLTDINLTKLEQFATIFKVSAEELLTGNSSEESVENERLKELLYVRDQEIKDLQKQIIELYKKFTE